MSVALPGICVVRSNSLLAVLHTDRIKVITNKFLGNSLHHLLDKMCSYVASESHPITTISVPPHYYAMHLTSASCSAGIGEAPAHAPRNATTIALFASTRYESMSRYTWQTAKQAGQTDTNMCICL